MGIERESNHKSGNLEVVLQYQQLRNASVKVLTRQQDTKLPVDEGPLGFQQVSVSAEHFQQAEHELFKMK